MKPVTIGMTHGEQIVAGVEHLASAVGNRGVHVVSSPATILFIEMACHRAIDNYLEPGEATVGVNFELAHRAAAVPGEPMQVTVELIHRSERDQLGFRAEVVQSGKTIMDGEHRRAVVELGRLLRHSEPQLAPQWRLWLDFNSPWLCLVLQRAAELAANCGAELQYCPVDLDEDQAEISSERQAWLSQDLQDHIELSGIPVQCEPAHQPSGVVPLMACLYARSDNCAAEFVPALARACWVDGRDINDNRTIAAIAGDCGLNAAEMIASISTDRFRAQLQAQTTEATKAGVFETPTIQFGEKLYCGYHGLDMLVRHTLAVATKS